MKEDRVISTDRIARWRWLEIKRKKCVIVSSVVAVLLIVAVVVTAVALNNVSGKSNHINKGMILVVLCFKFLSLPESVTIIWLNFFQKHFCHAHLQSSGNSVSSEIC